MSFSNMLEIIQEKNKGKIEKKQRKKYLFSAAFIFDMKGLL